MPLLQRDEHNVVPFFLDGRPAGLDGNSGKARATFPVVNAAEDRQVHHALNATVDDAITACASAGKAFKTWKHSLPQQRREVLQKVAGVFAREADEFVRLQKLETSATEGWARNNVNITISYLQEIATQPSHIMGTIPQNEKPGSMSFVFKEPIGTILCIPPWNAALVLATRAMATAIAAGCTVVLKASELSPATHYKIVETFTEAGLPPGVLNSLQVRREDAAEVTEALIADRNIKKVEFIGSASVGRIIGATAAKHLKPVLMELGGKCPSIVLDDADLEGAAKLCAQGAVLHHGQICFSTERVIVHQAAAERFKQLLADAFKAANIPGSTAVTRNGAEHAVEVLQDAKDKGAEFLVGGDADLKTQVPSLKPSIVVSPSREARIFDEETFGPSVSLYIAQSDEEAIEIANDSAYGLNATIHTRNMERGMRIARELEYGQVHMNSISVYVSPMGPQGGVKGSGWGRQNSIWGIEEFVQTKFVSWHPLSV